MGVIIDEIETTVSITPQRLFKSFILDQDNFAPKAIPFIKSVKCIEGDGGVGTIKLVTYIEGDQVKTTKHKIDEMDETNCVYKYTVFEGDIVDEDIEYFTNTVKIKSSQNEGSVYTYTNEIHTKENDNHNSLDKIKQRNERSKTIINAIEAYLLAHPHEYI
ncbi:hypothetical protein ACS0TY_027802 [Phlomoides rotata]